MSECKVSLFGPIAPVYGLFFNFQKRYYGRVLDAMVKQLALTKYKTIVDIGCGTGALCAAWQERGFSVTGIDPEQKMIDIARIKTKNAGIMFLRADVIKGLPFEDRSFDISIASYVAHGLGTQERQVMYEEMARVSKHLVIIHDFNECRSLLVDFIETLEGGDYFGFIEKARGEIMGVFPEAVFLTVGKRAMWYVGAVGSR